MADADNDAQRRELEDYYQQLSPQERRDRILLQPAFRDAYNEITKAHQVVQVPKYFWDNWAPVLGPVAATLYLRLRQYCYYNPETGERRDWCWPKQETLAAQVGIKDPKTLRKALLLLETRGFIKREAQYRQARAGGAVERTSDRYLVFFELPLIDSDAVELLVRQTISGGAKNEAAPRSGKISRYGSGAVENEPRSGKISPHGAREKIPSKKNYLEELLNERNVAVASTKTEIQPSGPVALGDILSQSLRRPEPTKKSRLVDVLPKIQSSPEAKDRLLRVEDLAGQILAQLGDGRSRAFYRIVARRFLEAGRERDVYQLLSEIKAGVRDGQQLKNPAAVFTARIKELARISDIAL